MAVAFGRHRRYLSCVDAHALVVERSLALHTAVAERLRREPALVERARLRVRDWVERGSVNPIYANGWAQLLDGELPELLAALTERSERMHDLRQVSPFAGFLDPRMRWRLHRETSARHASR